MEKWEPPSATTLVMDRGNSGLTMEAIGAEYSAMARASVSEEESKRNMKTWWGIRKR